MRYIVSAKEMKKIDMLTIENIGIPAMVLMERAAIALAATVKSLTDKKGRILVCVEGGNNGGDGLAVARLLTLEGYQVDIYYVGIIEKVSESFAMQKRILEQLGFLVEQGVSFPEQDYAVIVDGIFGVGLSREVKDDHKAVIYKMNQMSGIKVAIDIPSGIDATTGKALGIAFRADYTVTFGFEKVGMFFFDGIHACGKVKVFDIGFPKKVMEEVSPSIYTFDRIDLQNADSKNIDLKNTGILPNRVMDSNKGTYGKVAVIAGSKNMSGAAFLAAKAAYSVGAGLVKVYTHESNRIIIQTGLPEALLMTYEEYEESAIACMEDAMQWADILVIGSGLGVNTISECMVQEVLMNYPKPMVVDADAIHILAKHHYLFEKAKGEIIITPHMKEMSKLYGQSISYIKEHRFEVAKETADKYGITCVLKDAKTIVAVNNDKIYMNVTGNHGMSTGGTGDVLAGIIAGMIAGGLSACEAAKVGVYVHSLAGDIAAAKKSEYAMLASDVTEALPEVFLI